MSGMNSDLNHYHGEWNFDTIAVVVCSSISSYNAVELILLILTTFTHYRGLYFWSLTVASLGIIPYVFGYLVEYFNWTHLSVGIAIDTTGWILMVSGQALVLYSRLWIMFSEGSRRFLAIPKWMIIINAIVLHGMTAVAVYGSHFTQGSTKDRFGEAYDKVERIQMCLFCAQEFVLSGLYIWKAVDMLNTSNRERARHLTWQLFSINVFIIALDIGLLAIEFSGQHVLQQTVKGVTYSVKLKLELSILSKIKELSHSSTSTSFGPTNGFVSTGKASVENITRLNTGDSTKPQFRIPKWRVDLEKGAHFTTELKDPHVEPAYIRTHTGAFIIDEIQTISTEPPPKTKITERISVADAELLYADALHKMSIST